MQKPFETLDDLRFFGVGRDGTGRDGTGPPSRNLVKLVTLEKHWKLNGFTAHLINFTHEIEYFSYMALPFDLL